MAGRNPSWVAESDVSPSKFLKASGTTKDHRCEHAGAGDSIVGVSQEGTREAPIPGITAVHALAGEGVMVYGIGDVCEVVAAGTITSGARVASDGNGDAVAAAAGDKYGGRALASAVAGERVRIQVQPGELNA